MRLDTQQLHRITALATRAGLSLCAADPDTFAAAYRPRRYRQFELPPSFIWLCTICAPDQLSRIWINVAALGDLAALQKLNDDSRAELPGWPDELVAFGLTGDESYCFAYNAPDAEPAVVTVDSYHPCREDADGNEYVSWSGCADDFERWLAAQAEWSPGADAKSREWNATFDARKKAESKDSLPPRGYRKRVERHRDLREQARRRDIE